MPNIEQLENELNHKISELEASLKAQHLLTATLKSHNKILDELESLLKTVAKELFQANQYINELEQENRGLKSSCDVWMQRAIKLEFELLSARDAANKP